MLGLSTCVDAKFQLHPFHGCLKAETLKLGSFIKASTDCALRPPRLPKRDPETLRRHSCLRHELAEASRFMNKVIQLIVDGGLVMFKDTNKIDDARLVFKLISDRDPNISYYLSIHPSIHPKGLQNIDKPL